MRERCMCNPLSQMNEREKKNGCPVGSLPLSSTSSSSHAAPAQTAAALLQGILPRAWPAVAITFLAPVPPSFTAPTAHTVLLFRSSC